MNAVTAFLALGLLCSVGEARLSWQYGTMLRGLLQVQPLATQPAVTPPAVAQPVVAQPVTAQPAATTGAAQPAVTPPAVAQPVVVQPVTAQPAATTGAAQPAVTPPAVAQPVVAQPVTAQPAANTGAAQTAVAQPAATTGAAQSAVAQPAAITGAAGPGVPPVTREIRPGVYALGDPPAKPSPAPVAATTAADATTAAASGPAAPIPGKNLMVVMTVMGQDAREIYKNQGALKQQLAEAAGVKPDHVYFYNQTANNDARTGVTTMSLIMNVECTDTAECAKAGRTLYNSSSQTRLTDGLAKGGISLLPGTFQVYGVNSIVKYKGNETLYENPALMAPQTATTAPDYNATMARFNTPPADGTNATAASGNPGMPLGNFTIPGFTVENATIPAVSAPGVNFTQGLGFGNLSLPGALPGDVAPAAQQPAGAQLRSAAGVAAAGMAGLPLLVAAAAVLLL